MLGSIIGISKQEIFTKSSFKNEQPHNNGLTKCTQINDKYVHV